MTGYVISNDKRDEFLVVIKAGSESVIRDLIDWLNDNSDENSQALALEIRNSLNGVEVDEY
jgi:hypothetical protein